MANLAAVFDEKAPLENDIVGNFKYALIEHGPYSVKQPVLQFGAPNRIADRFDALANFGERGSGAHGGLPLGVPFLTTMKAVYDRIDRLKPVGQLLGT